MLLQQIAMAKLIWETADGKCARNGIPQMDHAFFVFLSTLGILALGLGHLVDPITLSAFAFSSHQPAPPCVSELEFLVGVRSLGLIFRRPLFSSLSEQADQEQEQEQEGARL